MRGTTWKAWVAASVAVLLGVQAGCSSTYRKLVAEDSVPSLREAKAATLSHENHTVLAPTHGSEGPNFSMAVHELETTQSDRVLVFIHGVFADHETWRFVAGDLARDHGVWLVDMPGCGESESPRSLREETYSIPDVAERTLQALRHCLVGRSPRVALVGHSFGAAVIVRMFCDVSLRTEYADVLDRVDRLVLISPLDISLNVPAPIYREVAEASPSRIRMASALGVLKKRVAEATMASVPEPDRALREEADKKISILRDADRRRALQNMIAKAVPWTVGWRPDWAAIEELESTYSDVEKDCLIVVGMRDEALPASMSYKLAVQLPRASFVPLKGVMHSPHIEAHEACAKLIREFVTTGRVDSDVLKSRPRVARP